MKDEKSNESRRKLLKTIAAGSGAVIAGKSLPENWSRPVVDSVMLPAHAQTSPGGLYYCTPAGFPFGIFSVVIQGDTAYVTGVQGGFNRPPSGTYKYAWQGTAQRVNEYQWDGTLDVTNLDQTTCVPGSDFLKHRFMTVSLGDPGDPTVTPTQGQIYVQGADAPGVKFSYIIELSPTPCVLPSTTQCSGGGMNCLAYDTPVLVPGNHYQTINSLQIGDMVTAINPDGTNTFTVVTKVITQHMRSDYYTINCDLRITDDHPVLVSRNRSLVWCRVDDLAVGDRIRSLNSFIDITSLEYHDQALETVYLETQCGNFVAMAGSDHYVVKSTYAEDSERLLKSEQVAFA